MRWAAKNVVLSERIVSLMLGTLGARPAGALLTTPKLHLSMDPAFAITPDTLPAALTAGEATFSGYAAGGVAWVGTGPVNLGDGAVGLIMDQVFLRTLGTPDVGNTIFGWWLDDAAGFVAGEQFGSGLPLGDPEDFLDLLAVVPMDFRPVFDNS
jgi:hypothetical protein